MASPAAVHNRQQNRAAQTAHKRRRELDRQQFEADVSARMTARFFPGLANPPLMVLSYRYWQARRCGWDPLSPLWAQDARGSKVDPQDGESWKWWCSIHPRQRQQFIASSRFRLVIPSVRGKFVRNGPHDPYRSAA